MTPVTGLAACSALVLSMLCALSPARAADIYRWVDESGQMHLSDTVPDKYRNLATRVDAGPTGLTPEQQKEAQDRAAREKARAAQAEAQRKARTEAPDAAAPAPPAPAIQPAPPTTRDANCAELLRRYRESQECFAPYRMANGAVRPEGFQLCGPELLDPHSECVEVNLD